ncbi:MAG: hypothetical protein ACOYVK_11590 [Bacillota bacterium]
MPKLTDAIERIKILECPTGDLEKRIVGILQNYKIAEGNQVSVNRDKRFDRNGVEGYHARISGDNEQSIVILAKSGMDDYVAKVVDAYVH